MSSREDTSDDQGRGRGSKMSRGLQAPWCIGCVVVLWCLWLVAHCATSKSVTKKASTGNRRSDPIHPFPPPPRLHSPLALTAWQLRSRFITCTRPRLRTQGNKKDLICYYLGQRSTHPLILSSLSTSSSSPTRKALCIDTAHEQQADTR